jgi:hypothetical protein
VPDLQATIVDTEPVAVPEVTAEQP